MSTTEKMDFFELGDKTSLICADPTTKRGRQSHASRTGIQVSHCRNAGTGHRTHALYQLRLHHPA